MIANTMSLEKSIRKIQKIRFSEPRLRTVPERKRKMIKKLIAAVIFK